MRFSFGNTICVLFCFLALSPLFPDTRDELKGDIRVGIFPFEPLNFIDDSGKPTGLYPDLLKEISRDKEWDFTFVEGSWAQGLERLQSEEIDLMISVAYSEERDRIMDFNTVSVVELWSQIFARPEDRSININDLAGEPVAIMARDINGQNFIDTAKEFGIQCEIFEYATHGDVFQAVRNGDVRAGVAPQHFGLRHVEEYDLIPSSIVFSPFSIYFAVKEGRHEELLRHIDYHLIEWKENSNSFYYRTLSFWMTGRELRRFVIPPWLIGSLAVLALLVLLFFLFMMLLRYQVRNKTEELERKQLQYSALVEYAGSIIVRLSGKGKIIYVNRFGIEFFALSREELVGASPFGIIFDKDHNLFTWINKGQVSFIDKHQGNRGSLSYIQWNNKVIVDEDSHLEEILCIGVDITNRLKIEKDLQETNQQLEEMVYIASHDLQVPLVSMDGYAGELLENYGDKLDEEGLYCLNRLQSNSRRMHKLVLSLLDISRLNTVDNYFSSFSLDELVGKIEMDMSLLFEKENIAIDRGALPDLHADRSRIEGVFRNLILNAISYGGKHISIGAKGHEITVSDDGIGIPESQLERIFQPGERLKMNKAEGVGMGLTFTRKVIEQHGGTIRALSEGKGKGSSFTISFPDNIIREDWNEKK